ncbi:enoyl-CoA hydratase/isomerase family protein [Aminipila luticellarii]|uniref:Enoyl-CoA hydratase/isomerase family protein n=1 Tax=Aminipila luticellarii TaxID=2507160 RepID=A0A410PYG1_9FIRM|nr:enoyl-CoA hydratase/isomerase family protein [Aminipila luticellarii]QAT44003.1 enoyl-CoA hydratase/isomerase family protein [Aminipila luticellarii]
MATQTQFVGWPTFDELKEMFKEHFIMERREDGVVLVRMHTKGESQLWSMELHDAIGKMWRLLGTDRETECIIFTGTGDNWISVFEDESWAPERTDPAGTRYDHMFIDGRRMLISMIQDVEVPTIGALVGRGGHAELALMCDICIMAEDSVISDPHYVYGIVPGDGIHSCLLELMGTRRAVYAMFMNEMMDAETCLKYGLVSEVVPREKLIDRAYEIADVIMAQNRTIRRLTTQVVRRPWKQRIVDDLDMTFGTEMFGDFCNTKMYHSDLDSRDIYQAAYDEKVLGKK